MHFSWLLQAGLTSSQFKMLEVVFALQRDWTEVIDIAEGLLISVIRSIQGLEKYQRLTLTAQRLYPSARSFKLGPTENGGLLRVRFSEAKAILKNDLGLITQYHEDFT